MNKTLQYYDQHAADFTADTKTCDMSARYIPFLNRVKPGGLILDLGCGSGRDSVQFLQRGYQVCAVDGSEAMCEVATRQIGQPVQQMLFEEINWKEQFDGIWACASLLHCTIDALPGILQKIADSLKQDGVLYVSFKYGDFMGWRNGRYFTNLTEARLQKLLKDVPELKAEEVYLTGDVRPGREEEQWLNAVIRKIKRQ